MSGRCLIGPAPGTDRARPQGRRSRGPLRLRRAPSGQALPEDTMARVGRLLVTTAVLGSGIGHALADLNRTHVFNSRWMPHARFHVASAVATNVGWSIASLWLLRRPGTRDERELALKIAALCPILSYAPFFIAVAVPRAEREDGPGR